MCYIIIGKHNQNIVFIDCKVFRDYKDANSRLDELQEYVIDKEIELSIVEKGLI